MTRLAILWHMHQPYHEDLATGEHILPWVRLQTIKLGALSGGGPPFLRALYRKLTQESTDIETVTMAEAARSAARPLPSVFPGSWINGDWTIEFMAPRSDLNSLWWVV